MIYGKRIVVVMPAYNAASTLEQTYSEIPFEFVDEVILVDDASRDSTSELSKKLGITTITHEKNRGLRRKSEDLLQGRSGARRGRGDHAASGLSVHAKASGRHGVAHCKRSI